MIERTQNQLRQRTPAYTAISSAVLQRKCACGNHTLSGEGEECKKEKRPLQRTSLSLRERGTEGERQVPPIVHEVLRSAGQPLDPGTRAFMEPRFGHDFSQVRVHTDAKAAESALAVNAVAYTVGQNHIVFGAGRYAPTNYAGRRLLAHELTHTIQQRLGQGSRLAVVESQDHEREADAAADDVLSKRPISRLKPLNSRSVSRQKLDPPAVKEVVKCEEFPGGSSACELDQTGTPTGKVTHRTDETNPCTKPCVEQHELVHVKQLKTYCPQLRDCYLAADKGKRAPE